MATRAGQGRRANGAYALLDEHKDLLKQWFIAGLTPHGVQAYMQQYNRECQETHKTPFPDVTLGTIKYHRARMRKEVDQAVQDEIAKEQLIKRRGLRDRDKRIERLEQLADMLMPYAGQSSVKGEFTASQQIVTILEQIRKEVDPKMGGGSTLDPKIVQKMTLDDLKKLREEMKHGESIT